MLSQAHAPMNAELAIIPQNRVAMKQLAGFTQRQAIKVCMHALLLATLILYVRPINVAPSFHDVQSEQVIQHKLDPLLQALHHNDLQAATRLRKDIQHDFSEYHDLVPGFVDAVSGIGSETALFAVMAWDGKQIAALAVQASFDEMVVSPQGMHDRLASRMSVFKGQLEQNRQDFLIKLGQALPTTALPDGLATALKQRLERIKAAQSGLFQPLSVKLAVTQVISLGLLSFSQPIAERMIARLPGRLAPALLSKGMKPMLLSTLIFTGMDEALSRTVTSEMLASIDSQMQQSEHAIQIAATHAANVLIQRSESDLQGQVQNAIHAEVMK